MLFFIIIMSFLLIVIFILPKYKNKKTYQTNPAGTKHYQYQDNTNLLALKFHQKAEQVNIFNHTITNSFFYTCELPSFLPFAVNLHSKPDFANPPAEKSGFSPNYNELDEKQQGSYIKWLAQGKPAAEDMGYVYLYYYGLEYRALAEKKDRKDILFEVIDLVSKFPKLRYGYDFIVYLTLAVNDFSPAEHEILTKFYLDNKPKYNNNAACNTILKNLLPRSQFKKEFSPNQLFNDNKKEKLSARKNEILAYYFNKTIEKMNDTEIYTTKEQTYYYTALKASSCTDTFSTAHNAVPYDALIPKTKIKQLYADALKIIKEEIKQTIKNFDNSQAPLTEIEKFLALPAALKKDITPPAGFTFAEDTVGGIEDIAGKLGFTVENTLTLRQSVLIVNACEALGYEIEPSAELEKKAYKNDSMVILYEKQFIKKPLSEQYPIASLFTDLGCQIALEDTEMIQAETNSVYDFIKKEFPVSPAELYRLQKRGKLIAQTHKAAADTIKKLTKTANSSIQKTIIRFVLAIAGKDGIIKEKEYKLLQKIAQQLSVPEEQLKAVVKEFIDTANDAVILEQISSKAAKSPQASEPAKPDETIKLQLDKEKLAGVRLNTAEIHTVLQEIFGEEQAEALKAEQEEDTAEDAGIEENEQNQPENGLQDIITLLLEKENWTRNELMNIIQGKGMMLNSLIDQINEWAENEYGDFLVEEEENFYTINSDVAELIKQNK